MKNIQVLLYTLAGLVIGVGIGMLFAPSAGKEIRGKVLSSAGSVFGIDGEEEFSDSEMEMDATNGRSYGF